MSAADRAASLIPGQEQVHLAEQRFRSRLLAGLVFGLVTLAALVLVAATLYGRDLQNTAWVDHTYAAESKINALATQEERLETARRGYLLSPRESYWRTYVETRARIRPAVDDLAEFTSDNPVQVRNSGVLRELVETKFRQLRLSIELAHDGDVEGGRRNFLVEQEQSVTSELRTVLAAMLAEEQRLLEVRAERMRGSARAFLITVALLALVLAALSGGLVLLMRRFAAELGRSRSALQTLNAELEDRVRERTADLSRANDEIQRFAYIVSHDLRSPLVNVMGFTSELETASRSLARLLERAEAEASAIVDDDMRLAVREDVPESLGFIRSSTKKMDRLINAILQLSRQGRRTLAPEPLDLSALVRGVVDSLVKLAEEKGAQVVIEPGLPPLVSDRLALEQVLSNLVENAVKYLQPGRPGRIAVRGGAAGGRVILEVEDNGRGIAVQDHERIFELFRRSGSQDQPGEGIGLAHVRALVYRLGGTIACISAPGQGSTFRVSLPPSLAADERSPA